MEFTPRSIINGELMRHFCGKNVSIFMNFPEVENAGQKLLKGTTTDNHEIRIQLVDPLNVPLKGWVEIIGIPASPDAIRCQEIILFESKPDMEAFDLESHNMAIQFLYHIKDIYKQG